MRGERSLSVYGSVSCFFYSFFIFRLFSFLLTSLSLAFVLTSMYMSFPPPPHFLPIHASHLQSLTRPRGERSGLSSCCSRSFTSSIPPIFVLSSFSNNSIVLLPFPSPTPHILYFSTLGQSQRP